MVNKRYGLSDKESDFPEDGIASQGVEITAPGMKPVLPERFMFGIYPDRGLDCQEQMMSWPDINDLQAHSSRGEVSVLSRTRGYHNGTGVSYRKIEVESDPGLERVNVLYFCESHFGKGGFFRPSGPYSGSRHKWEYVFFGKLIEREASPRA